MSSDSLSAAALTRRRVTVRSLALMGGDLLAFPLAWALAVAGTVLLERGQFMLLWPPHTEVGVLFSLGGLLAVGVFAATGHYSQRQAYWEEVRLTWRTLGMLALVTFSLSFFVQVAFTRTLITLAWLLTLLTVPLLRLLVRELLQHLGLWRLPALLVGHGASAREATLAIEHERHLGLQIAECVDEQADDIEARAARLGCTTLIVAPEALGDARLLAMVEALHTERFEVFVVPPLAGLPVHGLQAHSFMSRDAVFLRLQHNLFRRRAAVLKRLMDIVVSALALLVFSPLMLVAALRIALEDGWPVLFRHVRVGRDGQEFGFYKFRTMVRDAEAELERWAREEPELFDRFQQNFKLDRDPRLLRCGGWLRRSSIDELPQLWNVLKGDMSLVGPRPFPRRELDRFPPEAIELYKRVKPGITGLWQVSGRSDAPFEQRLALNNWYVRNWSLWVDIVILLKTVRVVLSGRGAT